MRKSGTARGTSRWKAWRWVALAVLAVLAAAFYFNRTMIYGNAEAGTAYAARVACSCRYVADRSLEDCAKDKLAGMELVTLSDDDETKTVTARFPLIATSRATLRDGYGCVLEEWEG
ncbi:hypothetical protein [Qipengyuania sp. JC766]|uniref:hypothetical protein n=1 Tax=Qipengyuania sp. JC766 TaxID=3232139 RepID=UPI003458F630